MDEKDGGGGMVLKCIHGLLKELYPLHQPGDEVILCPAIFFYGGESGKNIETGIPASKAGKQAELYPKKRSGGTFFFSHVLRPAVFFHTTKFNSQPAWRSF